jgi:N-acetylmuramoyl-L-alanine amidase
LTDEDRDAIRRWRSPRPGDDTATGDGIGATRSARTSAAGSVGATTLPDLPDIFDDEEESKSRLRRGGMGNRALILGGLLLLSVAVLILPTMAIPGFGFGDDPTPTPSQPGNPPNGGGAQVLAGATAQATRPAPVATGTRGTVCLDAGHGGWDMGRRRPSTPGAPQLDEASINLGMAWMLKDRLENEGFNVVMTRTTGAAVNPTYADVNGDGLTAQIGSDGEVTGATSQAALRDELQARINVCNEAQADILLSMHINGYNDASVRGYEVLYTHEREFSEFSFDLATFVARQLTAHFTEVGFQTEARGVKRDTELDVGRHEYGSERHLIMTGPAVEGPLEKITPSAMPGVVVEPLFISNDADAAFLADAANQQVIVDAYADAILQYFEEHPAGSQ